MSSHCFCLLPLPLFDKGVSEGGEKGLQLAASDLCTAFGLPLQEREYKLFSYVSYLLLWILTFP